MHKVDTKAVAVLGLADGTGIAIALVPDNVVCMKRKQYANISEHVLKVSKVSRPVGGIIPTLYQDRKKV